jgi:uncharacterized protein YbjT (DUF2867 family)
VPKLQQQEGGEVSSDMDHSLKDVTIPAFLDTLRAAVVHLDVVQPEALREPLALWFRATVDQVLSEGWVHLLGRPVVFVWNAALAVLAEEVRS